MTSLIICAMETFQLSEKQFLIIHRIKIRAPPRTALKKLRIQICQAIPEIAEVDINVIVSEYCKFEYTYWFQPDNLYQHFVTVRDSLLEMSKDPIRYLWTHENPLFIRRKGKWTNEECFLLQSIFNNARQRPNFSLVSLCFPGRTGQQIYTKFCQMVGVNEITDARNLPKECRAQIDPLLNQIFLPSTEKILARTLTELALKGVQVTVDVIKCKAKELFELPWILAERATYQLFALNQKEITNQGEYTDEFIEKSRELEEIATGIFILNEDRDEVTVEESLNHFLQAHSLKIPEFSPYWIKTFSRRNRFSWRIAHYARRGAIDQRYVNDFIQILAKAISIYGENLVFNMDETSVRVNNGSTRSLAPIGMEEVVVDAKRNSKECFTVIGTCTLISCKPLVILTKGITEAATSKFRASDKTEVWPTGNQQGWMNEDMMIQYLNHLHFKYADTFPCALLLDCYKAHRTTRVKQEAQKLGIKLVYVPANGTGKYQPLDRRVFGIVKAKLRSLAKSKIFSDEERFSVITGHLMTAWDQITPQHLISAWSIPGLAEACRKLENKEKGAEIMDQLEDEIDEEMPDDEEEDFSFDSDSDDLDYRH